MNIKQAMQQKGMTPCCNYCTHYEWYYDHCKKYDCEVDARNMCDEFRISVEDIAKYKLYNTESEKNGHETECGY